MKIEIINGKRFMEIVYNKYLDKVILNPFYVKENIDFIWINYKNVDLFFYHPFWSIEFPFLYDIKKKLMVKCINKKGNLCQLSIDDKNLLRKVKKVKTIENIYIHKRIFVHENNIKLSKDFYIVNKELIDNYKYIKHILVQNKELVELFISTFLTLINNYAINILKSDILQLLLIFISVFGRNIPKVYKKLLNELVKNTYPYIIISNKLNNIPKSYPVFICKMSNELKYFNSEDGIYCLLNDINMKYSHIFDFYDRVIIFKDKIVLGSGLINNDVKIDNVNFHNIIKTLKNHIKNKEDLKEYNGFYDKEYWKNKEIKINLPYSLEGFTYATYKFK